MCLHTNEVLVGSRLSIESLWTFPICYRSENLNTNIEPPKIATRCQAQMRERLFQEYTCLGNAQNLCSFITLKRLWLCTS